ncbi:uncharacterized protein LOC114537612 [Dendronephthya gigantea]|uniref:uncharacterized protein LOC114537612 n=1 Tax=Dendronephthya gigantea TaxID=151771 RepID=UPI00106A8647|nr:uncharacterized protein LOC114537612 [Dendronephthya gigantea]XP_028414477.1 uncharacterized protein LOC114537612 [Dendronephthya gigantea]
MDVTRQDEAGLFPRLQQRTQYSFTVQWTYIRDEEWMPVDHFLIEYNSSKEPEYKHIELRRDERVRTINDCRSGTKYSVTITSIDINGKAIIRAKPLIVETSAPIKRPILKLLHNEPGAITIGWNVPQEFGDGKIKEYELQVNGQDYAKVISTQNEVTYTDCRPLRTYTFRLQAISRLADCNSDFSHVLDVTCPGALPITLERAHCRNVNKVKVAWNRPICQGGARVREYQLYYLKTNDANYRPSKEEIMKSEASILHTLSPASVEDSLKVEADKYYWAFLEAEIVPDGCPNIITPSIQLHTTKKPLPPEISVDIYGLKERQAYGKEIDYLVDKRDR